MPESYTNQKSAEISMLHTEIDKLQSLVKAARKQKDLAYSSEDCSVDVKGGDLP